jgi:hypothetical protein
MSISKSPSRLTFQKEGYIKRCKEKGEEPNPAYLEMYDTDLKRYDARFETEESKQRSMEYDLLTTPWILEKVRTNDAYAQNLYAAMCNNEFTKLEVIPILKEETWSCSWRYAGGIIADMQQKGDYIDWYCSGIRNDGYQDDLDSVSPGQYVSEGLITDEIRADLKELGWIPAKGGDWENFNGQID